MIGAGVAGAGSQADEPRQNGGSKRMSMNGDAVNVGKSKSAIGGSPEMAFPGDGNIHEGMRYHTGNNSMNMPHCQKDEMHYDRSAAHATQDGEKMIQ